MQAIKSIMHCKCHRTFSPSFVGLLPSTLLQSIPMGTVPARSPSCMVVVVWLWSGTISWLMDLLSLVFAGDGRVTASISWWLLMRREYCDKGNLYQSLAIYYINFYMVWTALTNCSPNIKRWSCMKTRTYVCSLKVKMLYINYCRISHNIIWSAKCWFMLTAYTYNLAAIVYSHYHIYTYSHFLCYS